MSQFIITSVGMAAASAATPTGPWVNIVEFRIGSDYSTEATVYDTGLIGTELYAGPPASYVMLDTDTIGIRCELPAALGPFEFGEIGLYMPDGVLFARASLSVPQHKMTGSAFGTPNTWRFTAVIKFTQAPALFNIITGGAPGSGTGIVEVANFSLLSNPSEMVDTPNSVLVMETNPWGESIMLWKSAANKWAIGKYSFFAPGIVTHATATTIEAAAFTTLGSALTRQYLIQFQNGDIRAVNGILGGVAQLSQNAAVRYPGDTFDIYKADSPAFSPPSLNSEDFNSLQSLLNLTWSTPTGTTPAAASGWGQTAVPAVGSGVTPTGWAYLVDVVRRAAGLLKIPNDFPMSTIQSDWATGMASQVAQYTNLVNLVRQISGSSPADVPIESTDQTSHLSVSHTAPYTSIHHDVRVTFASATAAKAFFNSGGWVGYAFTMKEDNMVQSLQHWRLAQLGIVRFAATLSESIGSMNLRCVDGDGLIAESGNCGYYGIGGSRRKVWSHMMPTGTEPGTEIGAGYVLFEMFASPVSATVFDLEFHITDTSGSFYSNATNSPPFWIRSEVRSGRASSTLLSTPVIAAPTVVTLPSSTW